MKKNIFILIIFTILTLIFTYPLIFNLNTHISGFSSTDEPYMSLWDYWRINYSYQRGWDLNRSYLVAYPFGLEPSPLRHLLYDKTILFLSIIFSPALTYNFQILFNFILTGFFMYLLVYYLIKNNLVSLFSGIAFSFCPQHFVRSWQHMGLSYFQWMPFYLLMLFKLKDKPNFRNLILTALMLFVVASYNTHYFYFMLIATFVFIIWILIFNSKEDKAFSRKKSLKAIFLMLLIAFTIIIPQFFAYIQKAFFANNSVASGMNRFHRPFEHLFAQSAKPLSYFLPTAQHPIFGKFTQYFVGDFLYGHSFTEHALYLGWTTIILAFIAYRTWRRKRKEYKSEIRNPKSETLWEKENFAIGYFVLLAITAWFFSQPPWWQFGQVRIFMPSFFMYKILPMVRAYARFGIVVMLAVSVLAGFGLKFVLQRFRSQKTKIVITCLFSGLVLFEFLNFPPFKVIDLTKYPVVYDWLKNQPDDVVIAEYPLDVDGPNEIYKFYQTKHRKKIINSTYPGTLANEVSKTITNLSDERTAGVLRWLGVKYVLVHSDAYENSGLVEVKAEFERIKRNKKLKFKENFGDVDVYEVVAKPVRPEIIKEGEGYEKENF